MKKINKNCTARYTVQNRLNERTSMWAVCYTLIRLFQHEKIKNKKCKEISTRNGEAP